MRRGLIVLAILLGSTTPAVAQLSVGIGLPGVSIGINLPVYPELVPVPGYPVYYAPQVNSNYFFYNGMYWDYDQDNWYASSWYNGPWQLVAPDAVPLFLLRVPVRYYRRPPAYFRGWASSAPPRWGDHWGNGWADNHRGWDTWNRNAVPGRAPLPTYQRQYSGNRYPRAEQQQAIRNQNYQYQPATTAVARQPSQTPQARTGPATARPQPRTSEARSVPRPAAASTVSQQRGPVASPARQQASAAAQHKQGPAASQARPQPSAVAQHQRPTASPPGRQAPVAAERRQAPAAAQQRQAAQPPNARSQERGPQAKAPAREPNQGNSGKTDQRGDQHNG